MFFNKPLDGIVDPLAADLEKIVVLGVVNPQRRDRPPRPMRASFLAHGERNDRIAPAVADQDRAMHLLNLTLALEPVSQ